MVEAWLSLNGQGLEHGQKPPREPGLAAAGLGLCCDSTHSTPQPDMDARFKAKDRLGTFCKASGYIVVKNRACLDSNPEFLETYGGDSPTLAYHLLLEKDHERKPANDSWPDTVRSADRDNPGDGDRPHARQHQRALLSTRSVQRVPRHIRYGHAKLRGSEGLPQRQRFPPFSTTANPLVQPATMQGCNPGPPIPLHRALPSDWHPERGWTWAKHVRLAYSFQATDCTFPIDAETVAVNGGGPTEGTLLPSEPVANPGRTGGAQPQPGAGHPVWRWVGAAVVGVAAWLVLRGVSKPTG
jgi:hypothetical protein